GKNVYARIGRFGPMIQIGEQDDEDKPKFASVKRDQSIQTITLEDALELFKYPKAIGEYEGKVVKVNTGRFGPYIQHDNKFISINTKLGDSMEGMTIERAIELIDAKRISDANKVIKLFPENADVQLLNGRFGAYLKIGKDNFKLPKNTDASKLTLEECLTIAASQAKPAASRKTKTAVKADKPKKTATKKPASEKKSKEATGKKSSTAKKPKAKKK
ncbi:MAG: DNA topoisomerase I, partial [Crocinitomicaceae bacterium]|nr:DNA topoisomerase I [Crocinitomicaceae bacterium]